MTDRPDRPSSPTVQQGQRSPRTVRQQPRTTPTVQQGQHAVPPVQQQPRTTPTVQQATARAGSSPTRQQGVSGQPTTAAAGPQFPDQLADRYTPIELRGIGTEGSVWRCRVQADGSEVAVKVHFEGRPMDAALLTHLRNPVFHRHVPTIHDFGEVMTPRGPVAWVAMEHFQATLDDIIGSGLAPDRAKPILAEVAECLSFWQERVDRNPLDFKPDNLMVRSTLPLRIVLADFGGVAAFTASQQVGGSFMAAPAYTPPEGTWQEKGSPWPWWSLGEIAFLLVAGRSRHQRPDDERSVLRGVHLGDLTGDLAVIEDERWRLLVRGLLTREPYDRWTTNQVRDWLNGGSPPVTDYRPAGEAPPIRPITVGDGRTFANPADLAADMLQNWQAAERWLVGAGKQELRDWLDKPPLENRFDVGLLRGLTTGGPAVHRALLAFGAAFAPDLQPRWRGHVVDADGLRQLLGSTAGITVVRELVQAGVFGLIAGYRCRHQGCAEDRCRILDRLATGLPVIVAEAQRAIGAVNTGAGTISLTSQESSQLTEVVLSALLAPGLATGLLALRASAGPPWWRGVRAVVDTRQQGTDAWSAALAVAVVLQERAREQARLKVEADRERRVALLTVAGRRVLAAVASFAGMLMITWLAGVLAHAQIAFGPSPAVGVGYALATQLSLAPVVFVLAAVAAVMGRPQRSWLYASWVIAAVLGLLLARLPRFGAVELPNVLDTLLIWLTGLWSDALWVGIGVCATIGILAMRAAVSLMPSGSAGYTGVRSTVAVAPVRRLAVFGLAAASLLGTLWMVGTIRLSLFPEFGVPLTAVDSYMALELSNLLLVVLAVAALAASAWPKTRTVLSIGLLGVIVVGLWGQRITALEQVRVATAPGFFEWFGGLWGAGFWAAVLVCLPLVALSLRAADRLARL